MQRCVRRSRTWRKESLLSAYCVYHRQPSTRSSAAHNKHKSWTVLIQSQSSPRPTSPSEQSGSASTGTTTARPSSPKPPGGPATAIRRKAAADRADKVANARPSSTRAAGAGGSSSTMLSMSDRIPIPFSKNRTTSRYYDMWLRSEAYSSNPLLQAR